MKKIVLFSFAAGLLFGIWFGYSYRGEDVVAGENKARELRFESLKMSSALNLCIAERSSLRKKIGFSDVITDEEYGFTYGYKPL